ncbi:hypothetical protein ACH5RR_030240 [Cinchona calisaya]|uniref:Disease resistance N-terminal domain-containing protein n=1 Tax=Cinchona calisaya TaxID=153742 RepID=A0ABD2YU04_9GENT
MQENKKMNQRGIWECDEDDLYYAEFRRQVLLLTTEGDDEECQESRHPNTAKSLQQRFKTSPPSLLQPGCYSTGSKVTKLSDNLDLLKSVVTRYTEKHFENETLSKLAKQIRSLIHEAEDAIEEYVYYVALHRSKGTFDKALGILSYTTNVRDVSKKIEHISERVNEMYINNYVIGEDAWRSEQSDSVKGGKINKKPKSWYTNWADMRCTANKFAGADKMNGFQDAAVEVVERLTGKKLDQQLIAEAEKHKTELKQGQSLMVNLLTFSTIAPEFFTTTKNLKKLGIREKLGPFAQTNGESSLFYSLLQLELLENLKLHNDVVTCKLKALPFEHQFPTQLRRLSLQSTSLDWSHMSTLVKLKWLEVWKAKSSNFPQLNLKHCSNLEVIPSDLANVKSLQLIDLEHTSKSVVNSAKNMQLLQLRVLRHKRDIETSEIKDFKYRAVAFVP